MFITAWLTTITVLYIRSSGCTLHFPSSTDQIPGPALHQQLCQFPCFPNRPISSPLHRQNHHLPTFFQTALKQQTKKSNCKFLPPISTGPSKLPGQHYSAFYSSFPLLRSIISIRLKSLQAFNLSTTPPEADDVVLYVTEKGEANTQELFRFPTNRFTNITDSSYSPPSLLL